MQKIAKKLEFITGCVVEVRAIAWIGRKVKHKNSGFRVNFRETVRENDFS